jgi:PAS domain S-box-containing protein
MAPSTLPSKRRWRFVRRGLDPQRAVAAAHHNIEDLKRTEGALRRSQDDLAEARRELQLTIDSIPAMVITFDAQGERNFANRPWRDYTGLTLEEVTEDYYHPEDRVRAERAWRASLATGEPLSIELRIRRADGAYRWHAIRRVPLRDDTGKITKWHSVAFDIEEQKGAEDALRRSEAQLSHAGRELRLTLDTIPALVWQARADGFVEYINERWLDYTGLSLEEALGWGHLEAVYPDDRQRLLDGWRRVLASEKPADAMARIRGADGVYRWFLFQPAPLRDESGKLVRWYGTNTNIEDRKRAESALQRSETYLAEAQRLSHTGSFGWNVTSGEIFWSAETFRIFEYEPTPNVTIEMVLNRVHPDDLALVRGVIDRAIEHKEGFDFEHRLQMPDGSVKHLHVVARTLTGEPQTQKLQFAGAVMDMTERKQAFARLEASEQRYRNLFHHMPVALWQLNARGLVELFTRLRSEGVADLGAYFDAHPDLLQRCMEMLIVEEVNEKTVQMLGGRDTNQFAGTTVADYFPKNSPTFRRSMVSRYRNDPNYAAETKLSTLDGRTVDVLYTATRVGPISGPGMSLLGVIDITERKQAEEALRRSERRYQNLFQAMAVAFFEFDFSDARDLLRGLRASGITDFRQHFKENPETVRQLMRATRIIEVNDHTVALVGGGGRDGLLGNVEQFWPEESTQAYAAVLLSALERKRSFSVETPFCRVDRSVFHGHFTVWYSTDEPTRGLAGVIDISERVKAQAMLHRVQADFAHAARISMLGELTASIAHEVNQPLAAIAAGGEASLRWLDRPTPDLMEVRQLTKGVVADARRASDIIGSIHTMAARRAPEQALLSLDDVIREALLFLRHEVELRGVTVSHVPTSASQQVFADRTQLQQVVVNLVVNAVQAIALHNNAHRSIMIRTVAQDPATLHCSVEDSGSGIEPQHITRLFDSFFTTKDGGMGMGLRICRSVIEAHGGRIGADNASSHGGARFFFTLPIARTTH